jgi:Flp pilus assembly pilin Flp
MTGGKISAKVELPCSIRLGNAERLTARGVTEELTRESLIVVTSSVSARRWLKKDATVLIAVDLPCSGASGPRVLECEASLAGVRKSGQALRLAVTVRRMAIIDRNSDLNFARRPAAHTCSASLLSVITRSQNRNPVAHPSRATEPNLKSQGALTMSKLKNFFAEEDGQDMVEYGLVISLVVIGGVTAYGLFGTAISGGINSITTSVTSKL